MVRIVVGSDMGKQLAELDGPADLFDEVGRTLGRFTPARGIFQPPPEDHCPHTADELAAMRAETGGQSLEEIWKDLGVT